MPFYSTTELVQILADLGVRLKKSKGQCYLIDQNIVKFIIETGNLNQDQDRIIEIGPGLGTLSDLLIQGSKQVFLMEQDNAMVDFLQKTYMKQYSVQIITSDFSPPMDKTTKVIIYHGDALQFSFPTANKIIANIPYQISGPLLLKIIETWQYDQVLLMVQKEFVDHIMATPNSEHYSRISAVVSLYLEINKLKNVPPTCFFPHPKVNSVIISLIAKPSLSKSAKEWVYRTHYFDFLRGIFPYKNKNLHKALKFFAEANPKIFQQFPGFAHITESKFDLTQRVRTLSAAELFNIMIYGIEQSR